MLQYTLSSSERYTTAELAQMAIEGGCQWINLHFPDSDDASLRDMLVPDVVEMCREAGVFLLFDDRPSLARELGLHGVRLSRQYFSEHPEQTPAKVRDELGPEAVIGIELADPSAIPMLFAADIDFVTLPANFDTARREAFLKTSSSFENTLPVVAQGDITPETAIIAVVEGCQGVAASKFITDSADPVEATRQLFTALQAAS